MKINKATRILILQAMGMPKEVIDEHVKDGDIDMPEIEGYELMSNSDIDTLKSNTKKGMVAKEAVLDIAIKEIKKLMPDFDFDGKDAKSFVEAAKEHFIKQAKIEPNDQVKLLEKKIQKLETTLTEKDTALTTATTTLADIKTANQYKELLHPERNTALTDDEWIARLKNNFEIVEHEGKTALKDKATGEFITDSKGNIRDPKEAALEKFEKTDGWKAVKATDPPPPPPPGGRVIRTKNSGQVAKFANMKEVINHLNSNNIPLKSQQARALVAQAKLDNPEFDANIPNE